MEDLPKGFVFKGKFEVLEKKGKGSLNETIYHGRHLELDRPIIIRVLPPDVQMTDEIAQRFLQGIRLAANLLHPNIVAVLDAGEENGFRYFVTNYEKGFYLNEYLEHRGQLDEMESARLVKGLADALDYAWSEQRIVHRNVCPNTILIAKGNAPMLTDFGLAKSLGNDAKLTLQGYAVGDPLYMSPEQARGMVVDLRSDIYCLGLVLYQLLDGKPPFTDGTPMEIMQAHISKPHTPIKKRNELVSDACAAVLDKMLRKDAGERYQSWEELQKDLDALLNSKPPAALGKAPSKKEKERIRRESEKKAGEKYKREMDKVKMELAKESRRRFKRNMIILAVVVNIAILIAFLLYLNLKREREGGASSKPGLALPK